MKIHFLGTAASEGIPNPFCRCEHCQQARIRKGKDIRTHSSAIIDDQLLIDVAPEFSQQLLRDGMDATEIRSLLFTHTHPDHFNVGDLFSRMEGYGFEINHPLNIFGNDRAINGAAEVLPGYSAGLAPIFPYTFYHLTHDWFVAADIPVGNDIPVHYADAIRCNVRRPPQGSLPLLTRRVSA